MKSMTGCFRFSSLLFVLFIAAAFAVADSNAAGRECEYTLNVKTGTIDSAGTDSNARVTLSGAKLQMGKQLPSQISRNGVSWDPATTTLKMGIYTSSILRASCIPMVCSIVVTSDGSWGKSGWYLEYVEVNTTGPNRPASDQTIHVEVNQWLAIKESPYSLTVSRNQC